MKLGVMTDIHVCRISSIVAQMGDKYSVRLENIIKSINWAEEEFKKNGCELIIICGDMFDKAILDAMELTMLKEIKWANIPHIILVGNHELELLNAEISSAHIMAINENFTIIDKPCERGNLCFLPYTDKHDSLNKIFSQPPKNRIIFSHNDLKGVQYATKESTIGFDINDIEKNCKLFINGHLHNNGKILDNIINIGNLTGQNFGENAFKHTHNIMIVDSETAEYELIENPHAFNFYKIDFSEMGSDEVLSTIKSLKSNAVVSATIKPDQVEFIKEQLKNTISRIVIKQDYSSQKIEMEDEIQKVDHLEKFKQCVMDRIGNNEIVMDEIKRICL